ncbi:hypothetical protein E3P77_02605 [Wallemia ichthyophaga]|nr:hypothetical protein E3P77_02605 [Wallemia ichthyophaga]
MPKDSLVNVIVTGANSGVGFGISQRILSQVSSQRATDVGGDGNHTSDDSISPFLHQARRRGLRLILACRSQLRAEGAIKVLQREYLDAHARTESSSTHITLQYEHCDLSSVQSSRAFAERIKSNYTSIASLICNAGGGTFSGIDWVGATVQMLSHPLAAVTYPTYKLQSHGATSSDNLGWVFQMNIFGHFIIARELTALLEAESRTQPTSILWMSSLEASKCAYDLEGDFDMQRHAYSYEASKYLTEALAIGLDEELRASHSSTRSVIVHPGVVWSSIFYEHLGVLLDLLMALAFYMARWCGSPHHCISAFLGALSTTHVLLNLDHIKAQPARYASCCDRWGHPYVVTQPSVVAQEGDLYEMVNLLLKPWLVALRIGYVPEHFSSPLLQLAERDGGATFVLVECPSGTGQIMSKLAAGEIDISIALTESLLAGRVRGNTTFELIGTYIESPLNWAVITAADSPYCSLSQLQGTTFGISRAGSGSQVMANVMALEKKWSEKPDFAIQGTFEALRGSVNDGSTSAFMWEWFTTLPYVKSGEVKFVGNQLTPWPSWSIVAGVHVDHTQATAFLDALDDAVRLFDKGRSDGSAVQYVHDTFGYDKDDVHKWLDGVTYSQNHLRVVSKSVVENTLNTLVDANVIEKQAEWDIASHVNTNVAKLE